jgi:hypothetical protein
MKTKAITALLALSLACISPVPSRAQNKPEIFTCVMTWVALGIFACCVVACYYHAWNSDYSGPTNSPPAFPPTNAPPSEDDPPLTNPPFNIAAFPVVQNLDVSSSNWVDERSSAPITNLARFSIQSAPQPVGPWTNAYVVTLWESAYGDLMLVEDGAGRGLSTNYTRRSADGNLTNRAPLKVDLTQPSQFYRAGK